MSHQVKLGRSAPPPAARITIAAVLISLTALSCKRASSPTASGSAAPVPAVAVATVVQKDVPIYEESVGTTVGFVNADILPKVSGYLLKQDYQDGSLVRQGELLFEIDPRQYQAALDQALGNLARSRAQNAQNQQDLARYTKLFHASVIPQQQFDNATHTTRASQAQVQADQAAVESARLNLQWTKVYSPINGVAGIAQAQVGDLVSTGTLLTTVSQVDPIKVAFPISEKLYLQFAAQINASQGPNAQSPPPIELILDNGSVYRYPGRVYAVNRQVDVQTGTIMMQAVFPNPDNILRPGMYAKVRARTDIEHNALLVPQTAVFSVQGQYEVAVVGADNKVTLRPVNPGIKIGSSWVIDGGLKPGDSVIADGAQKVPEGMEVKPVLATQQAPPPSGAPASANPAGQE